jgi:hypothetical protein
VEIDSAPVGTRIRFEGDRMPYTVQARDERFLICTRPFAPQRTVLYTVVDLEQGVRGPDDRIFGQGYETRAECRDRLHDLRRGNAAVSRRRGVPLRVAEVLPEAVCPDCGCPMRVHGCKGHHRNLHSHAKEPCGTEAP